MHRNTNNLLSGANSNSINVKDFIEINIIKTIRSELRSNINGNKFIIILE